MIFDPIIACAQTLKSIPLLLKPGIRRFVIIPVVINFIIFSIFIGLGISQFNGLLESYMPSLPEWLQWLDWLLWPAFMLSFLIIGFLFSMMLANLVAAPFNGLLAEAIEKELTTNHASATKNTSLGDTLKSIVPSIHSEIKKFLYFIMRAIPLLILFIIPGINLFAPFIWIVFSAWLLGLEYLDYPLSNHGILFSELRDKLKKHRLLTLGFGGTVLLITTIPIINFFAMPIAVAGATSLAVKRQLHISNNSQAESNS